jgi:hypothetical protein
MTCRIFCIWRSECSIAFSAGAKHIGQAGSPAQPQLEKAMTKSLILFFAVVAAFVAAAFVLPPTLNASPATGPVASAAPSQAVSSMAGQFETEKMRAVQQELPAQF